MADAVDAGVASADSVAEMVAGAVVYLDCATCFCRDCVSFCAPHQTV